MTQPFFTIGHSNRSFDAFAALLDEAGIELVADIRTIAASRANPQFDREPLRDALAARRIAYEHMASLGGLRGKARTVAREVNRGWTNDSFHNYADYALSAPFRAALDHLVDAGQRRRCALMCAEAVWWRCHRRIVSDHLIARGETVFHVMAPGRVDAARLTPGAVIQADRSVVYPVPASGGHAS